MEFRKMVTITLYTRQYNIIYDMSRQSRFDARYWMLGAGALGWPRGMVWGGRREEGSGWATHVYLWQIHFDIWQNQYNIVKLNKIKFKKNRKRIHAETFALLSLNRQDFHISKVCLRKATFNGDVYVCVCVCVCVPTCACARFVMSNSLQPHEL